MKGFGYLFKEGVKNVWSNRMMSIASIGVLISCLLLTGAAVLVSVNMQKMMTSVGDSNVINVYLKTEVSDERVKEIETELLQISNIHKSNFYSKEKAISEFEEQLGSVYSEVQGEQNPLPDAYHVTMVDLSQYDQTVKQIKKIDGVDQVSNRRALAERITSLNNLVSWMGFWIIIILGIISLFIISNAIKMTMYSRRFEISIMKSVGATNGFVRMPFVVEGMIIGLLSGVLSFIGLYFLYEGLMQAVTEIINLSYLEFSQLALPLFIAFIGTGMLIGAVSGMISIGKYLKKEGNEILGW